MATVNWATSTPQNFGEDVRTVQWSPLTTTNADGQAFAMAGFADRSVQVFGTYGAGGILLIQGTNELVPTNWMTLNDPSSAALSFATPARIEAVLEVVRWIRPFISAGDGTTSLTCILLLRKS